MNCFDRVSQLIIATSNNASALDGLTSLGIPIRTGEHPIGEALLHGSVSSCPVKDLMTAPHFVHGIGG